MNDRRDIVDRALAKNFNHQGEVSHFRGKYHEAEQCYNDALKGKDSLKGFEDLHKTCSASTHKVSDCDICKDIALIWHNHAKLFDDMGNYEDAEQLYLKTRDLRTSIWQEKPDESALVSLVETLYSLAMLYHHRWHEYDLAEQCYNEARKKSQHLGENSLAMRLIRANQAQLDLDLAIGQWIKGDSLSQSREKLERGYRNALKAYDVAPIPNAVYLRSLLNNMAVVYHQNGNREAAKQRYEKALQIYRERMWTRHFSYAVVLTNYAKLLQEDSRQRAIASKYYQEAASIYWDSDRGEYHSFYQVADFLHDYAQFFLEVDNNNNRRVLELLENALEIYTSCNTINSGNNNLIYTLNTYYKCYWTSPGGQKKPEEFYEQMIRAYQHGGTTPNLQLAQVQHSYAFYLWKQRDYSKAKDNYAQALTIYTQYIPHYISKIKTHVYYRDRGKDTNVQLIKLLKEELDLLEQYTTLLVTDYQAGHNKAYSIALAEQNYRDLLKMFQEVLGEKHWLMADFYSTCSKFFDKIGYKDEARTNGNKARWIRDQNPDRSAITPNIGHSLTFMW